MINNTVQEPWMTLTVGTHATKNNLRKAVTDEGHKLCFWAMEFVDNKEFAVETTEREVELFKATLAELGLPNETLAKKVHEKLDELGFTMCPDETALQLRRAYKDQPLYEAIIVVSEPRASADGIPKVLLVERSPNGSEVSCMYAFPTGIWWGGSKPLVFCRK
jgi:hypothetical protein